MAIQCDWQFMFRLLVGVQSVHHMTLFRTVNSTPAKGHDIKDGSGEVIIIIILLYIHIYPGTSLQTYRSSYRVP